jgi:septum site-determining protein MinD
MRAMPNPYSIVVSSQKGGVGKTTISVNLATSLRQVGYKVLVVDADYSNPSVGFHLGLQETNAGVRAVIEGRAKLADTVAVHNPTGLHVLTGEISTKGFHLDERQENKLKDQLEKSNYNFVVIDMPPGAMRLEEVEPFFYKNSCEVLIVLTPEMAACASAIRLAKIYEKIRVPHSMVANKVKNKGYELGISEIEDAVGESLIATLPEDENVPVSIAQHIPVLLMNSKAPFSRGIKRLTRRISNRVDYEPEGEPLDRGGFMAWLRRLFFRRGGFSPR